MRDRRLLENASVEGELAALASLLEQHHEVPVKIVALHHSPNIPARVTQLRREEAPTDLLNRWAHQFPKEERRALRTLCKEHRVRLILHGHLHRAEDRRIDGLRILGAPASTEPLDPAAPLRRYALYHYTARGRGGRVERELLTI